MTDREKRISENLGLVHSCCRRFMGRGIEYDDLYQAGCVGLVKAVDRFDESRGLMFSTYAVPVILGEVRRLFREGGSVKVSRPLKELSLKAVRASDELTKSLGRPPLISELAQTLGVSEGEAAQALCASQPAVSLTAGEDGQSQTDIPCEDAQEAICESIALSEAVNLLDERDQRLIKLRFFEERTQTQTALELGMTQVQVSRREKAILTRIRQLLECG